MPAKPKKVRDYEACEAPAEETKSGEPNEPGGAEAGLAAPIATRIGRYHDFKWSRELWYHATFRISRTAALLVLVYLVLASVFAYLDGLTFLDTYYFIATEMTTVSVVLPVLLPGNPFYNKTPRLAISS